jgi:HAE1 family hydrophobic/amphiphilic exporter-1
MEKSRPIVEKAKLQDYSMFLEKNTLSRYLASEGENFQIKVFYEEIPAGRIAAGAIMAKIKDITDLKDLNLNTSEGKPLYKISFRQHLLDKMNISRKQVADYIIQAVRGEQAGELRKIQRRYDIYVRVPVAGTGIMDSNKLLNLPIKLNDNNYYLRDLIKFEEVPSIKEISRESQERFFVISANVEPKQFEQVLDKVRERLADVDLPLNTRFEYAGEEEERKKAFDSLNMAIILAIVLVYMVMAAQFENVFQPLIIMLTVPMGLIGAFIFIMLSGNSLNIISGIGIMVLIGIGVNDAIVKVEFSNQLRRQGMSIREAVLKASRIRLRPILMTTFTTIFGLVPMAMMSQTGSELQKPLAFVVIGGLFFTTGMTLILIPVCYEVLENLKERLKTGKKQEKEAKA